MSHPKTLLEMAGASMAPAPLAESAVVLIDCQMEYVDGRLPLVGVEAALAEVARLLELAREKGVPVVHVAHRGASGGLFASDGLGGEIAPQATPRQGERVVGKTKPNAFAGTDLDAALEEVGRKNLIVAGFMTHMCVSSTVRAALDLGYACTVVDRACATRDLPDGHGGVVEAGALHRAELVALSDRFAVVVDDSAALDA